MEMVAEAFARTSAFMFLCHTPHSSQINIGSFNIVSFWLQSAHIESAWHASLLFFSSCVELLGRHRRLAAQPASRPHLKHGLQPDREQAARRKWGCGGRLPKMGHLIAWCTRPPESDPLSLLAQVVNTVITNSLNPLLASIVLDLPLALPAPYNISEVCGLCMQQHVRSAVSGPICLRASSPQVRYGMTSSPTYTTSYTGVGLQGMSRACR